MQEIQTAVRVSDRYSVTITFTGQTLECEWAPSLSDRLTKKEMQRYRRGRDALLARVGALFGGGVIVVET